MILEQIDGAIERMVAQVKKLDEALDKMKAKQMTTDELMSFYDQAVKVRYGEKYGRLDVTVTSRRTADDSNDLFTVYNRVQEALIRGSEVRGANGRFRQRRSITNIGKDIAINQKLFDLASSYITEAVAA
jgi:hypothetical protein